MNRYKKEQLKKDIIELDKQCKESFHKAIILTSKYRLNINHKINCKGNFNNVMCLKGSLFPASVFVILQFAKGLNIKPNELKQFNCLDINKHES
jgi:hypothetical protein